MFLDQFLVELSCTNTHGNTFCKTQLKLSSTDNCTCISTILCRYGWVCLNIYLGMYIRYMSSFLLGTHTHIYIALNIQCKSNIQIVKATCLSYVNLRHEFY